MKTKKIKSKLYVGCFLSHPEARAPESGKCRELFRSKTTPTWESHGKQYAAVIGPFHTKAAAELMRDKGQGNPHLQTVAECEAYVRRKPLNDALDALGVARNLLSQATQKMDELRQDRDRLRHELHSSRSAALDGAEEIIVALRNEMRVDKAELALLRPIANAALLDLLFPPPIPVIILPVSVSVPVPVPVSVEEMKGL